MMRSKNLAIILSFVLLASVLSAHGSAISSLGEGQTSLVSTPIRFPIITKSVEAKAREVEIASAQNMKELRPQEKEVVSYHKGENLAAVSLYLANKYQAPDAINVVGGVRNSGSSTQNDVVIQFFLEDPHGGGTQIGSDVVISSLSPGSTVYNWVTWSGFTGSSHIYFVVDPYDSLAEENEGDNADSLAIVMVDDVPWVWQEINGFCNYAGLAMLFNFYGADHNVYEAVEFACCPHSMLYLDDWLALYAGWRVSQSASDYEFAGLIRNLAVDMQVKESWPSYLAELKTKINAGIPFVTSVDPYYLPQDDWDLLRVYDVHSGHAAVVVGYTDSSVILHDPGVGLPMFDQPAIPHPENRGDNVVVGLDSFRAAVESTLGASYLLISYTPTGPMPSDEVMFLETLDKSIDRLWGYSSAYDSLWAQIFDVFGAPSFASLKQDMTEETFQVVFNDAMASAGGNLAEALDILALRCDLWGCQICWEGSACYYGTLSYPEAAALSDLSAQLSSVGEDLWTAHAEMLGAIYDAGGNLSVAEPYLSQMASDLDQITPLEDSVLVKLQALYGYLTEVGEREFPRIEVPNIELVCYPNPFNSRTSITYVLPSSGDAHVAIYNLLGQRVRTLVDASQETGRYEIVWNGQDQSGCEVASGLYFCRMRAGGLERSIKMVLVK